MKRLSTVIVIAITMISTSQLSALEKSVPRGLQTAADCMYHILKKEPGFEEAKLGVTEDTGFAVPYVQYYSPADALGRRITVRFTAQVDCTAAKRTYNCCPEKSRYCFLAVLGGVFSVNEPGPPDGDASVLIKKWNATCGLYASALFV